MAFLEKFHDIVLKIISLQILYIICNAFWPSPRNVPYHLFDPISKSLVANWKKITANKKFFIANWKYFTTNCKSFKVWNSNHKFAVKWRDAHSWRIRAENYEMHYKMHQCFNWNSVMVDAVSKDLKENYFDLNCFLV